MDRWLEALQGAIYESIEWLDRQGMAAIETQDPALFRDYLRTYWNTICGRHPIGVLLQVIKLTCCPSSRVFGQLCEQRPAMLKHSEPVALPCGT